MTRRDILTCIHEPLGDAFYFGPERLSTRYENDEQAREESGFAASTYKHIFDRIEKEGEQVRPNSTLSITSFTVLRIVQNFQYFVNSISRQVSLFASTQQVLVLF